jgi:hypothetical protein
MDLPVWVTVVVGRIAGGFVTGIFAGAILASELVAHPTGSGLSQSSALPYSIGVAVVAAVVTGLVTAGLLPPFSGRRVGIGTAVLASFAGEMIPFIGATLFTHAALSSRGYASWTFFATASPLLGLGLTALGIVVTVWMIQSSVVGGSPRGPRYDLYSRARQNSLDEPPEV